MPYHISLKKYDTAFVVKLWVIGQKVCVTNPNKLENL